MNTALKNFIFYIVIAGEDKNDHLFLRNAIYRFLPQAIVESIYEPLEMLHSINKSVPAPHLIFLDLNMIKEGGKEMLRLMREAQLLRQIPMVVLTDHKQSFTRNDLARFGANEFYSKPYHMKAFDQIVADLGQKLSISISSQNNKA